MLEQLLIYISASTARAQKHQLLNLKNVYSFEESQLSCWQCRWPVPCPHSDTPFLPCDCNQELSIRESCRPGFILALHRPGCGVSILVVTARCPVNLPLSIQQLTALLTTSSEAWRRRQLNKNWAGYPKITGIRNYQQYLGWREISLFGVNTFPVRHLQIIPKYHLVRLIWEQIQVQRHYFFERDKPPISRPSRVAKLNRRPAILCWNHCRDGRKPYCMLNPASSVQAGLH